MGVKDPEMELNQKDALHRIGVMLFDWVVTHRHSGKDEAKERWFGVIIVRCLREHLIARDVDDQTWAWFSSSLIVRCRVV
jgi:hypothetical protein